MNRRDKMTLETLGMGVVCGTAILLIGIFGIALPTYNQFNLQEKVGTIVRVELLSGHIGSTMDKTVIAFQDGSTLIVGADSFGLANQYVNKTVVIKYNTYLISNIYVVEGYHE